MLHRTQYWDNNGFDEGFTYDKLNRISVSTVTGQPAQNFAYDAAGNILSKTEVSNGANYAYPAQGPGSQAPHAVQSIPGIGNFSYDLNGNMTAGAGRNVTWNNFDMPVQISRTTAAGGTVSSSFVYGAEHQRLRQDRSDGSKIIYAGAQEVEVSAAGLSTVKTYWPHGIGVEIDRPGAATTELNWVHHDRLGSPVAITDQNGSLKEKLAYDAWGKRRSLDGSSIADSIVGVTDNKGFTGHEMLEALELVHMNGRVYDPLVGRFMSGDPLVQDPTNGQNYNRYSYVLNNPTNLTDPTGFAALSGEPCTGTRLCGDNGKGATGSYITCEGDCRPTSYVMNHEDGSRSLIYRGKYVGTFNTNGNRNTDAKTNLAGAANSADTSDVKSRPKGSPGSGVPLADFSDVQRVEITGSLTKAQHLTDQRLADMDSNSSNSSTLMNKWFFNNSKEDRARMRDTLSKLSSRLHQTTLSSFLPSGACMPGCAKSATNPDVGGFVYSSGDPHIYLNDGAFNSEFWSLSRIIIHEESHFLGTEDLAYGIYNSLNLGLNPTGRGHLAAERNADSISFFVTGGQQ